MSQFESDGAVPVTVVSGTLGAGKTTLVKRVLEDPGDRTVAVVVNDVGEFNVDAELLGGADDGIVDLSNGCICCELRGDLLDAVERLAETREFDHLVIEASGVSEPQPLARLFVEGNSSSTERYRLAAMVTVLDAYGFWKEFDAGASLPAGADRDEERPLADVLVDGIEFCDFLLVNKCDLVPDDVLDEIQSVVRTLQPRAEIVRTVDADVDPERVLDADRFDFDAASREQGWKRRLAEEERSRGRGARDNDTGYHDGDEGHDGDEDYDGDEGGHGHDHGASQRVVTFVYARDEPFHPGRLGNWIREWDGETIRAKGFCWVAGRDDVVGLNRAGPSVRAGPIGSWGDDDRRTRLVFIGGRELDESRIVAELDACLVDESERGNDLGLEGADPFPIAVVD